MSAPKARVLLVDDATLVRRFYRRMLEAAGFAAGEALEKHLRAQAMAVACVPVLMTSTGSQAHDRLAARQAGANFYLVKPVAPDTPA